ncbi:hypothetical protein [Gracilibacillus salinarum]|uniref:N-acetyltransferase domain-containing protein n=1 Tax=Gracilibacillus salinarum TaxID=2932255 RepID=A0ABY4GR67_9BACI|nr:hypothetical protein [Gracilibacillus salinarum]UOQ86888.1 hypothetical protein MUN87_08395 [Gracilibacillus salinarum]
MFMIKNMTDDQFPFLTDMLYESIYVPENKPPKEELLNVPHLKKYYEDWGRKGDRAFIAHNSDRQPVGAVWYRLFEAMVMSIQIPRSWGLLFRKRQGQRDLVFC